MGYHAARGEFTLDFKKTAAAVIEDIDDDTNTGGPPDEDDPALLIPTQLLSAQFLEMDTSPNMNIINQDDQYLNVTFPPNNNHTLSFTSISATLDPSSTLEDQLEFVPGGVILILVASTESGEIVRNRVMWTYTMECSDGMEEDVLVVEVGDEFAWAMFVSF